MLKIRRLATAGAIGGARAPEVARASTSPDAALMAAVVRFYQFDALVETASDIVATSRTCPKSIEGIIDAATAGWDKALAEIEECRPVTQVGLQAMAGVIGVALQQMVVQSIRPEDGGFEKQASASERLAMRFARKIQCLEIAQ